MIEQVSKVVSIEEQRRVCRIKLRSAGRARKVVEALNGRDIYEIHISSDCCIGDRMHSLV